MATRRVKDEYHRQGKVYNYRVSSRKLIYWLCTFELQPIGLQCSITARQSPTLMRGLRPIAVYCGFTEATAANNHTGDYGGNRGRQHMVNNTKKSLLNCHPSQNDDLKGCTIGYNVFQLSGAGIDTRGPLKDINLSMKRTSSSQPTTR